jgi:hypothetical protein
MVLLHMLESGQAPVEPSQDGDVIADVRADRQALIQVVRQLCRLGFALERTERVMITHEGRSGQIPRPTLLGAIVMKAAATELPSPARHYRDVALLCSVVGDPFDLAGQLTAKDRQRLRKARALADDNHIAWSLVPAEIRGQGQITFSVLTSS